jgi:hypothetical protein
MKAIVHERYRSPDVLKLRDIDQPSVSDDGILAGVGVHHRLTRRREGGG